MQESYENLKDRDTLIEQSILQIVRKLFTHKF